MARFPPSGVTGQQLCPKERWSIYGVSRSPKAIFARWSTEKQEMAQRQESKTLDTLNSYKSFKVALSYDNLKCKQKLCSITNSNLLL